MTSQKSQSTRNKMYSNTHTEIQDTRLIFNEKRQQQVITQAVNWMLKRMVNWKFTRTNNTNDKNNTRKENVFLETFSLAQIAMGAKRSPSLSRSLFLHKKTSHIHYLSEAIQLFILVHNAWFHWFHSAKQHCVVLKTGVTLITIPYTYCRAFMLCINMDCQIVSRLPHIFIITV